MYMSDEGINFLESIVDKSEATITQYVRQYVNLTRLLGTEICAATQKRILNVIDESDYNLNSEQAMLNVAILVRRENEYENARLIAWRTENLARLKEN